MFGHGLVDPERSGTSVDVNSVSLLKGGEVKNPQLRNEGVMAILGIW